MQQILFLYKKIEKLLIVFVENDKIYDIFTINLLPELRNLKFELRNIYVLIIL